MPRFTLDKFSARKTESQIQKDKFAHLKPAWNDVRKSTPSDGSIVLWDPPKDLLEGIKGMLEHEQSFARDRQKNGVPYLTIQKTIGRIAGYIGVEFPESDEQSPQELTGSQ